MIFAMCGVMKAFKTSHNFCTVYSRYEHTPTPLQLQLPCEKQFGNERYTLRENEPIYMDMFVRDKSDALDGVDFDNV